MTWRIEGESIVAEDGRWVLDIDALRPDKTEAEAQADARLIAAAPALLGAARRFVYGSCDCPFEETHADDCAINLALNDLARAIDAARPIKEG